VRRLLAFCEAPADFRIASSLVDRVLHDEGPPGIGDLLGSHPEAVRAWASDDEGREFCDIHRITEYTKRLKLRVPQGHFDGKPGSAAAMMARTAIIIARAIAKGATPRQESKPLDAVFIVCDMDDQGEERRLGLDQARDEARSWVPFQIVLGCPDPMREAWVLAGFDPQSDEERTRLAGLRQELGFSPCDEAHRLGAKKEQAKKSPKRVLEALTDGDHAREERCWMETPLATLRARGFGNGLQKFLDQVAGDVLPLFTSPASDSEKAGG
jgi:hypothetical protein